MIDNFSKYRYMHSFCVLGRYLYINIGIILCIIIYTAHIYDFKIN